jgi:hypothetical protein
MSPMYATRPLGLALSSASSSSVGGISSVVRTEISTVPMEQTEPMKNAQNTQKGIPAAVAPLTSCWNT